MINPAIAIYLLLSTCLLLCTTAVGASATENCSTVKGITPLCGFQAPEDMVLSPDRRGLIISEFGGLIDPIAGRLVRLDLATEATHVLYPKTGADGSPDWGDDSCPGAPGENFAPHGVHLSRRADGAWQLLAINHHSRESVEFFELHDDALRWRGCVVLPARAFLNDLVSLPDGGFIATHMMDRLEDHHELIATLLSGEEPGQLWEWHPGEGLRTWGPDMRFPNGIESDPAGNTLFVNFYLSGLHKIDRASGAIVGSVAIPGADNISWASNGHLLVASQTGTVDYANGECTSLTSGFCPMAFQIVLVDPVTLHKQVLLEHQGEPMGAGTVAIEVDGRLYIGSFAGDRLIKTPPVKINTIEP